VAQHVEAAGRWSAITGGFAVLTSISKKTPWIHTRSRFGALATGTVMAYHGVVATIGRAFGQ
jgi:hypothetical protein